MEEDQTINDSTITVEPIKLSKLKKAEASFGSMGLTAGGDWSPDEVDKMETYSLKEFHKCIDQCRFFYRKDPIAGTILNKMVEIGVSKLVFDKGKLSDNEFRVFEAIQEKLQEYIENCALEYLISGLIIPEIKYATLTKEQVFDLGVKKYQTLTLPVSMWLRDPRTIKINSSMVLDEPSYYVILPEELVSFIMNRGTYPDGNKDIVLYNQLLTYYPEFVQQVLDGNKEILLENKLIIRRKVLSDSPYPTPFLYGSIEALKHKRNLRRMDYSIASRVITAIMLIKLGNDEFPITEDDEDAFTAIRSQMTWRNTSSRNMERIFQLFANHTLEIEWVYPNTEVLLNDKKYAEVNQDIFLGMGFPRILTTGETERTQTSDPEFASISPVKTMEKMQRELLSIVKGIIREITKLNNLKYIPEVRFSPINLNTFNNFVNAMSALYDTGNISRTSYDTAFGYNWEEELALKIVEKDKLEASGIEEFAPQPFSPQPSNTKTAPTQGKKPKKEEKEE